MAAPPRLIREAPPSMTPHCYRATLSSGLEIDLVVAMDVKLTAGDSYALIDESGNKDKVVVVAKKPEECTPIRAWKPEPPQPV